MSPQIVTGLLTGCNIGRKLNSSIRNKYKVGKNMKMICPDEPLNYATWRKKFIDFD